MIYWRYMRIDESNIVIPPTNLQNEIVDYAYSNEMRSHSSYKGKRAIWSLAKTPEAALKWAGPRGKGNYNRLAAYDFDGTEGEFYDLTDMKSWISLIHKSKNGLTINNINGKKVLPVEAIRSIIPCMSGALSMAKECEEIIFIPHKSIEFKVIEDYSNIIRNPKGTPSVLTELYYDNNTLDGLLNQLEGYNIERKTLVKNQLKALKVA